MLMQLTLNVKIEFPHAKSITPGWSCGWMVKNNFLWATNMGRDISWQRFSVTGNKDFPKLGIESSGTDRGKCPQRPSSPFYLTSLNIILQLPVRLPKPLEDAVLTWEFSMHQLCIKYSETELARKPLKAFPPIGAGSLFQSQWVS